jgi:hypothetical protein
MNVSRTSPTPYVSPAGDRNDIELGKNTVTFHEQAPPRLVAIASNDKYALQLGAATALREAQLAEATRDLKSAIDTYNQRVETANHVQAAWGAGGFFGVSGFCLVAAAATSMLAHPVAITLTAAAGAAGTLLAARSCTKARHAACRSPSEDELAQKKEVIGRKKNAATELSLDVAALKNAPRKEPASASELDARVRLALEEARMTLVATDPATGVIRLTPRNGVETKTTSSEGGRGAADV